MKTNGEAIRNMNAGTAMSKNMKSIIPLHM